MPFLPFDATIDDGLQLVVTLGPPSLPYTRALAEAGATGFRFNASHFPAALLADSLVRIKTELPDAPVLVDLQGAKMRVGGLTEKLVKAGDIIWFSLAPQADTILLPHPELFRAIEHGQTLSCDDGRLRFRVMTVEEGRIETMALEGGTLRPRKGINLVEHPIRLEGLTAADLAVVDSVGDVATYAYSFIEDGREAQWLKKRLGDVKVIGKLERRDALDNFDAITRRVDALWVCRGDLGEQIGVGELARWVAGFDPRTCKKPVLMAGQVVHCLTWSREISRSEVCHLYDLLARGYAGFVLSDETAVGIDPVLATGRTAKLIELLMEAQT